MAYITAMVVMYLVMITLPLIMTFRAYDEGDPQLLAGGISEALVTGLVGLVLLGPILFLFQWFVLRRHKKRNPKVDVYKTFS